MLIWHPHGETIVVKTLELTSSKLQRHTWDLLVSSDILKATSPDQAVWKALDPAGRENKFWGQSQRLLEQQPWGGGVKLGRR